MTTTAAPATTSPGTTELRDPYREIPYQKKDFQGVDPAGADVSQGSDASKEASAPTEAPPAATPSSSEAPKAETTKSSYTVSTEVGFITHRLGGNVDQKSLKGVSTAVLFGGESLLAKDGRSVYYQAGVSFSQTSSPISGQTPLARQDATSEEGASRGQTEGVDAFGNPLIEEDTDGNVANNNGTANVNNLDVTTNHITTLGAVAEVGTRWQLAKATVHAGVGLNVFGASGAAVLNRYAAGVQNPTYGYSFYGTGGISRFVEGEKASVNFGVAGKLGLQALNYNIPGDASGGSANMGVIGGVAATFGVTTHRAGNRPVDKKQPVDQSTTGGVQAVGRLTQDDIKAFTTPAGELGAGLDPSQITTTGEQVSLDGETTFESMTIAFDRAPIPKDVKGNLIAKITIKYDASRSGWVAEVFSDGQSLPVGSVYFPIDTNGDGELKDVFPHFYTGLRSGQVSFLTAIKQLMASPPLPPKPIGLTDDGIAALAALKLPTVPSPTKGVKEFEIDLSAKNLKDAADATIGKVKLVWKNDQWFLYAADGINGIKLPSPFGNDKSPAEFKSMEEFVIWVLTAASNVVVVIKPDGSYDYNLDLAVSFASGKSELTSEGKVLLDTAYLVINSLLEADLIDNSYKVYAAGLSSRDKSKVNFDLANNRGGAVDTYLSSLLGNKIEVEAIEYKTKLAEGVYTQDGVRSYYAPEGSAPYVAIIITQSPKESLPEPTKRIDPPPAAAPKPSSKGKGGPPKGKPSGW